MTTPENMDETELIAFRGIGAAVSLAHATASNAGWYKDPATGLPVNRNFGEVIALMQSELSEALEADRKSLPDDKLPHRPGQEVEFADTFIRIGDTSYARDENLPAAFIEILRLLQRFSLTELRFALTVFRLCEASGEFDFDLEGAIIEKNRFNKKRADHKLENRAAGGKRY